MQRAQTSGTPTADLVNGLARTVGSVGARSFRLFLIYTEEHFARTKSLIRTTALQELKVAARQRSVLIASAEQSAVEI